MQDGIEEAGMLVLSGELISRDEGFRARFTPCPRPQAAFLAQILACHEDVPAYRARRRAEPDMALACYDGSPSAPRTIGFERVL
jgi:hypothetical protein